MYNYIMSGERIVSEHKLDPESDALLGMIAQKSGLQGVELVGMLKSDIGIAMETVDAMFNGEEISDADRDLIYEWLYKQRAVYNTDMQQYGSDEFTQRRTDKFFEGYHDPLMDDLEE